ncbi:MAG: dihydropteroate synthase [Actinobacteria bacterium]|nr:dihydropteroate synthase [Actinomycetota bacterium]
MNDAFLGDLRGSDAGRPLVLGVLNLSKDSSYRTSIVAKGDLVRRARLSQLEGADIVDVGVESTNASAARVPLRDQQAVARDAVASLVAAAVPASVETYDADTAADCLAEGARLLNLTGQQSDARVFDMCAEHGAGVLICYSPEANVRHVGDSPDSADDDAVLDQLARRVALARAAGVTEIAVDPGIGFFYANQVDPSVRIRYQVEALAASGRFQQLGVAVCQSLPHAFHLFGEHHRSAEVGFATLAILAGVDLLRTHEPGPVRALIAALLDGG